MVFSRILSQYLVILSMALVMLISGCSSDDDDNSGNVIIDPEVDTTPAPSNLMGIWTGVITKGVAVFDMVMIFHYPDGAEEGRVVGVAASQATGLPYLLIDSGYMEVDKVAHPEWDFDYLIGREGSQGTALKRYAFANKLVSQQSGTARLNLEGDDTLTGTINFEGTGDDNLGEFYISIKYWNKNLDNTATLATLADTWTDPVDDPDVTDGVVEDVGWDDQSRYADLVVAGDGSVDGSVTDSGCKASSEPNFPGKVMEVNGHNIFLFGNYYVENPERLMLDECGTRDWNDSPLMGPAQIGGIYDGLGMLIDDNGTEKLYMILTSTTNTDPETPGNAIFNEFTRK
jgi:hypothetical protein